MTQSEPTNSDETFEISANPETALKDEQFEGSNVCRVAMLSTRFTDDRDAIEPLATEYQALGFSDRAISTVGRQWQGLNNLEAFRDLFPMPDDDNYRLRTWIALNESGEPQDALRFLVAVLGSDLERESTASAAVLWRQLDQFRMGQLPRGPRLRALWEHLFDLDLDPWLPPPQDRRLWPENDGDQTFTEDAPPLEWDPAQWGEIFQQVSAQSSESYPDPLLVLLLVSWRLRRARHSIDPVTVSLAMAAFEPSGTRDVPDVGHPPTVQSTGGQLLSTMIHGTWGWKGDWWRPGSPFHTFILRYRGNLYSRGAKYSWSGALSEKQRILAAKDFAEWSDDLAPDGLQTVFGHSYGGEVAARAVLNGARINEIVFLSAPVTPWVEGAIPSTSRVIDVRLRFDPVLGIAQTRQRIQHPRPNTTVVLLDRWRYSHSATHDKTVWLNESIAQRGQL